MTDLKAMSNVELLDHAFAHTMSGEYHVDSECCDDAREETLRRMVDIRDTKNKLDDVLVSNVIKEQSLRHVPPLSGNPLGCDAEMPASRDGRGGCRCMTCSRCGRHTGNSGQGHYWAYCKSSKKLLDFHFCCPGACELGTR